MRRDIIQKQRAALSTGILVAAAIMAVPNVAHGTETSATLRISPRLCVIDVTQDGTNQTLQTPTEDCMLFIPNPTTAADQPAPDAPELPFAGADPIAIQRPDFAASNPASWSPVATTQQGADEAVTHTDRFTLSMIIGIVATLVAATAAIDVFVLESGYTKTALRKARQRIPSTRRQS